MTKLVVRPDVGGRTMWHKDGDTTIYIGDHLDPKTLAHEICHVRFHRDADDCVMAEIEAVLWSSVTSKIPVDKYDIANIVKSAKYRGIEWDELEKMLMEAAKTVGYKDIRYLNKSIAKAFKSKQFLSRLGVGFTTVEREDLRVSMLKDFMDRCAKREERIAEIEERLAVLSDELDHLS